MTNSNRLLIAFAAVLLLGAGGAGWLRVHTESKAKGRTSESPSDADFAAGKSSHDATRRGGAATTASLPPHLKKFVRDMERHTEFLDHEHTHADTVRALMEVEPFFEGLDAKDVATLIFFYRDADASEQPLNGPDLCRHKLYQMWGRLDPAAATEFATSHLRDMALHGSDGGMAVQLLDPFIPEPNLHELKMIYAGWCATDARAALAHWNTFFASLEQETRVRDAEVIDEQVRGGIVHAWAEVEPSEALAFVEVRFTENEEDHGREFVSGLRDGAPWRVIAEQIVDSEAGVFDGLSSQFAAQWAKQDPDAAIPWIREQDHDQLQTMLWDWHHEDESGQALSWLQDNFATIDEELRLTSIGVALELQDERKAEVIDLVRALPRNDSTWHFLLSIETSEDPFAVTSLDDGAGILFPSQLRKVMEALDPPANVRLELERKIENASANR